MSTEVRCTISDCEYWADNNYCASSGILITHGSPYEKTSHKPAHRQGTDAYELAETPIHRIADSYCRTFTQKNQDKAERGTGSGESH
jgi:hypothetical protein